jgi:hypothetical protein
MIAACSANYDKPKIFAATTPLHKFYAFTVTVALTDDRLTDRRLQ